MEKRIRNIMSLLMLIAAFAAGCVAAAGFETNKKAEEASAELAIPEETAANQELTEAEMIA